MHNLNSVSAQLEITTHRPVTPAHTYIYIHTPGERARARNINRAASSSRASASGDFHLGAVARTASACVCICREGGRIERIPQADELRTFVPAAAPPSERERLELTAAFSA